MGRLAYLAQVRLLGRGYLAWQRIGDDRKLRAFAAKGHPTMGPPLRIGPRTKELVSRHYLEGQYVTGVRKVAWVTSGAPVEFLKALDYYVLYPENHAALCGARRKVIEIASEAEAAGYSQDLCSYARTDLGSMLSGKTPVGRLPKPDLLVACTNICQTVLAWYRVLAHHFQVPLAVIDTPFLYREAEGHAVAYVQRQIEGAIETAERVAGRKLDSRKLRRTVALSKQAVELWLRILETGKHRPSPISAFDEYIHMAPIVEMRGDPGTVDFYGALLGELEERVKEGVGAIRNEKKRLLWDNLPIWYRLRWLSELLAARGISVVASTYTNAWGELASMVDPERPIESAARTYLHPILNRGTGHKLKTMRAMVEGYEADGVLLHSDRSCKPYSIGQMDQRERLARETGVPALLLEADHGDPRAFSEEQAAGRIEAFAEMLGA